MFFRSATAVLLAAAIVAGPVSAQRQSLGYQFLEAIKKRDAVAANKVVANPGVGSAVVNYQANGEGAIHIVARDGDTQYLSFVLGRGADPDLRNGAGDTPLIVAVSESQGRVVEMLVKNKARIDLGNRSGETPLIRAVQNHNVEMTRLLLTLGANPDQADIIAGKSARDYAVGDARYPAIAKLLQEAPKRAKRSVSGPQLR
ncbi:MAG TPA: ankyrin repeat domain-containing protein [Sphingomicrobium sp.]|jgi:ankyrin repeat protein